MKKIIVNTNGAFEKDVPMRKTVDLTDDIGHVVRVGFMDDKTSVLDVGTLISKDFSKVVNFTLMIWTELILLPLMMLMILSFKDI